MSSDSYDDGQQEEDHSDNSFEESDDGSEIPRVNSQNKRLQLLASTRNERTLCSSLESLQAEDLSLHLFSIHHLKRRLHNKTLNAKPWQNKTKLTGGRETISRWWTAWPARPIDVPRGRETFAGIYTPNSELDEYTVRSKSSSKPSDALEEILLAEALKQARDRFFLREWQRPSDGDSDAVFTIASDLHHEGGLETSDEARSMSDPMERVRAQQVKGFPAAPSHKAALMIATPMADDEKARQLLRPSIRHILSKLDDLLIGLHNTRKRYYRRPPEADTLSSVLHGEKLVEIQADRRGKSSGTHTKKLKPDAIYRSAFPRDWSDLLGMTCMTGWDDRVVSRSANRCTTLLEENMDFRALYELPTAKMDKPSEVQDDGMETNLQTPMQLSHEAKLEWPCPALLPTCYQVFNSLDALKTHTRAAHSFEYADFRHRIAPLPTKHVLEDSTCPDPTCRGYYIAFKPRDKLHLHMVKFHKNTISIAPRPRPCSALLHDFEEILGGVHVDGFLKPVPLLFDSSERRAQRKRKANAISTDDSGRLDGLDEKRSLDDEDGAVEA